jgi:sugar lactone lactonase YvrE
MKNASINRRQFVKQSTMATAAAIAAPTILCAQKTDREIILGQGPYKYKVDHNFLQLPAQFTWQTTHDVAVDKAGQIYVIHEGDEKQPDHPSIFVFDADGKFVRAFGQEFQGGGHGLEVHAEGSEEFLYVTAYQSRKMFAKLNLKGERVWLKKAPMSTGIYAANEDSDGNGTWGRDRFMPTNIAFRDDGGFYVADGYGAWVIHRYDAEGNHVSSFGKPGTADGEFNLPHGIWIDDRDEKAGKQVVVADRVNMRLQWFTLEGKHLRTQTGFLLPANIDSRGELLLVPELQAQITLLDKDNNVAAVLGGDPAWREKVLANNFALRSKPAEWQDGKFLHPHDACFDADGNILVAEWVQGGRMTKLTKV